MSQHNVPPHRQRVPGRFAGIGIVGRSTRAIAGLAVATMVIMGLQVPTAAAAPGDVYPVATELDWGSLSPQWATAGIVNLTTSTPGQPANPTPGSVTGVAGRSGVQAAPVLRSDLAGSPLGNLTLVSLGLEHLSVALPLSSMPLRGSTTWQAMLANTSLAGVPLISVTWTQVVALDPPSLADLKVSDVDWSGSILRDLPLAAFTFGGTELTDIELPGPGGRASKWCALLNAAEPRSCPPGTSLEGETLISAGIKVADLKNLPLRSIPLRSIDLTASPLRSIPLRSIVLNSVPLRSIPLRSIDLQDSPLRSIPLRSIDLATSPLRSIPLRSINWRVAPLRSIPLRSIDLATSPIGAVPLRSIDFTTAPLRSIPLRSIDLATSPLRSIPLRSIDWSAAGLGSAPLSGFVVDGGPLAGLSLASVAEPANIAGCAAVTPQTCAADATLGSVEAAGDLLPGARLGAIGASGFAPTSLTLQDLLGGLPADSTLGDLRLDLLDIDVETVAGLVGTLLATAPEITLGDLRFDLMSGTNGLLLGALLSHLVGGALDDLLLGDIGTYTTDSGRDITLGDLGTWTLPTGADITLGDLAAYLPESITLADVLLGLIPASAFPYENFPFSALGLDVPGRLTIGPDFQDGVTGSSATLKPHPANYQSIRLGNPSGSVTAPVDVRVTLPPGATLRDVKYQDADDAEDLGSDVHMDRAPDGSVQFIVPDFRLAANSYGHVQFNYDLGATLGPQLFGVTMLDPNTGDELTSRTDLSGAWDISDGQEPNSPFEARYNPIPNAATTPLTTDSRIPNLPTNPAGCSSSNDSCAGLDRVYVDVLASGHISYAGDVDWFRVKGVKAGTRLTADLTNLPLDADLVLYGPATLAASPSLFPKNAVGLPGQLIEDPGLAIGQSASSLAVSALAGLRLDQGYTEPSSGGVFAALTPLSISQHRGTENEAVGTIAPVDGDYVVQVSGHNTETSPNPYVLRVRGFTPDDPMFCSARTFSPAAPAAGATPAIGADVNTIFLTNPSRLAATHGQGAADGVAAELQATVDYLNDNDNSTKGLKAAVVPVDSYAAVREAYDAWDANPCSVPGANGVTAAITGVLAGLRTAGNDLDYVTLVGGDDLIPMGRVADLTRVGNESEYASTFQGTPNPLAASSTGGFTLTDDPYGDPSPTALGNGNTLFVPQISVGRLVETPDEITGALTAYRSAAGVLDTHTALVSGYDFLADGALSAADRLETGGRTVDGSLIDAPGTSTPWTSADLLGKLFPSGQATPMMASVNAHYDHQALLSAAGDAGDGSDLVTAAEVAAGARLDGAEKLAGRVLFTMGCHAGLAVPDAYVGGAGAATAGDWAQTLAEAKVAVYVANTGYGIGDSSSVAYTERLMALYAKLLDGSLTAGQALTYAKQAYYGSLGAVGVYDTKILQQSTFYGLPFWEVSTNATQPTTSSTAARPAATVEPTTDPTLGLQAPFTVTPILTEMTTADGRFWTADGMDSQVTHYQPTQPKTTLSVTATGKLAHGALISSLTSHDVTGVRPVVTTPVVDTTAAAPSVRSDDAAWPASIANITTWHSPEGLAQDLVLMPGQFTGSTHDGTGVQRLFDRVGASVLYRDPSDTDFTAPTVTQATGKPNAGVMTFSVTTIDPTPNGSVQLVRVGYQGASGAWLFTDLARDSEDPTLWTGSGIHPNATSQVPFFVQSVDASGNVGVANGKVGGFFASGDTTPPTITASVDPAPNAAGWIKAPKATVTFTCSDSESGVAETACPEPVDVTVDGGTTVTGTVRDRAGNNASTSVAVQLDNTPPVLVATVAPAGWTNAESATVTFTCSDPASGLVGACPDPVTATAEGSTSVERTITDVAGNSTTVSRDLRIDRTAPTVTIEGSGSALTCRTTDALSGVATSATGAHTVIPSGSYFVCTGAMDNAGNSAQARRQTAGPITFAWTNGASAAPTITTATRGENIVVRFRLTRDGGDLTDPSMVTGIAVRNVACSPWGQPAQPWESVMGANSVKYNAKERSFQFGWKTPKVTSCYEFRISLIDQTSQIARFRLG